ncbi:adenylyltransferase/cytidyltransferase family protein [Endozoicomonas sp. SCSIO W0465]|uniref:adenylyltransferase/cytidyltransferase family protein n=1 Tax=Endozoicomonas sp. SCSIO W0465 TaxID=2918516 RepID=UPI002075FB04|nr:adenylyltransferase/cytidyltransferase family protein [Endozoicomonas sp. SCSIO W0465]USE36883.1 adenylyltransferase/cytidyltransferase family protein [Endozoicomonas sp. SCSIO W0465]
MSLIRLGIFGSAFDPPTLGHLDVLQQAATGHDCILLVPSAFHAFDKNPLPFSLRLQMLQCFIDEADVGCPLEVCDLESELLEQAPGKPVYTYDLMTALTSKYQGKATISFIRGPDNASPETWKRFYKWREIEKKWPIFTATERLAVRSSDVRKVLESSKIADDDLQQGLNMLLPSVQAFIMNHNLYQTGNS